MASRAGSLPRVDLSAFEPLAVRAGEGDDAAWKQLVTELWPVLRRVVGQSPSMGSLGASDDHVSNVLTSVVQKLGGQGGRGLKLYGPWKERHPDKGFGDWIHIVTANAVRDYVREHAGDASEFNVEVSVKRFMNEFKASQTIEDIGHRPPFTAKQTARQILAFAEAHLEPDQHRALTLWLDGSSFEEISAELALRDAEGARKVLRAAVATLRRVFGGGEAEEKKNRPASS